MSKKIIMLACSAGMSTSLLVTKMQEYADKQKIEAEIFALSANEALNKIGTEKIDVVLLGPQIRFMEKQFRKKLDPLGIPSGVINIPDYGSMNGQKVFETALNLIQ